VLLVQVVLLHALQAWVALRLQLLALLAQLPPAAPAQLAPAQLAPLWEAGRADQARLPLPLPQHQHRRHLQLGQWHLLLQQAHLQTAHAAPCAACWPVETHQR
jgi:hypothetical protein